MDVNLLVMKFLAQGSASISSECRMLWVASEGGLHRTQQVYVVPSKCSWALSLVEHTASCLFCRHLQEFFLPNNSFLSLLGPGLFLAALWLSM